MPVCCMKTVLVAIIALVLGVGASFVLCDWFGSDERTTLVSLSPDDSLRVHLVEIPALMDRNFEIRVESVANGQMQTVFRSPDEGRPVGSERIVWSADGTRFILLGRHFHVPDAAQLPTGEVLYLMYEVGTGRAWCNATQQREFPGFSRSDMGDGWPSGI